MRRLHRTLTDSSYTSAHEQRVPLIGYNGDFDGFEFSENRDMGRYVFERVLAG